MPDAPDIVLCSNLCRHSPPTDPTTQPLFPSETVCTIEDLVPLCRIVFNFLSLVCCVELVTTEIFSYFNAASFEETWKENTFFGLQGISSLSTFNFITSITYINNL